MHAFGYFVLSDRVDHVATSVASVQAAAVGGSRQSRATGRGGKDEARAEREPGRPAPAAERARASWDFHLSVDRVTRSHDVRAYLCVSWLTTNYQPLLPVFSLTTYLVGRVSWLTTKRHFSLTSLRTWLAATSL